MTGPGEQHPDALLKALLQREAELRASRRQVADLNTELEETNRGLIALHAELEDARQAEARLAAIVQSSDDAMLSFSADGIIQTWNPGAEHLFGYGQAETAGQHIHLLLPAQARERLDAALRDVRSGTRAKRHDAQWRDRDGALVDVAITVSGMRDTLDALTGFTLVLRDITARLQVEAELAAVKAEQQVMADRDRIARDLHDLVIQRLFATAMTLLATTKLTTQQPEVTRRLRQAVDDLDDTIRQIRSSIFALQVVPDDEGLRKRLYALADAATHTLGFAPTVRLDGLLDTAVDEVTSEHLLAVVNEALSNTARHARASRVHLSIDVTDNPQGGEVELRIEDDGIGLPAGGRRSGLANMADRARTLGGTFHTSSGTNGGTLLRWRVPLAR